MMPFYFDSTYILVIIGALLSMWASVHVKSTYNRYNQVSSQAGLSGAQAAMKILRNAGINDVTVEHVRGNLTDHYDPGSKVLRLSDATYNSTSIAAVGVAAHECGHAIQHDQSYVFLGLRSLLVPVANIGSTIAFPLILIGMMFNSQSSLLFINLGIVAFSMAVLFQIITLPVEFNASNRALAILDQSGMLSVEELTGTKKVLSAAALTYVAGAAASLLQLLRLVLLSGRRRD